MTLFTTLFEGVLGVDPTAPVMVFEDTWYSWGDIDRIHRALNTQLNALSLGGDARIGLMLRNRPGPLVALLSVVGSGRCAVAINPLLPDDKLIADIERLTLPVIVGDSMDVSRPGVLAASQKSGVAVLELSPELAGVVLQADRGKAGNGSHDTSVGVIIEMLTSGTTGEPKRVHLKRRNLETSFSQAMAYEADRRPGDSARLRNATQILTNPLAHIGGMWGALSAILAGRKVCLMEKFTVEAWRQAIVAYRPKISAVVPAGLRMVLDSDIPKADLSSLVALRTGTAPLDNAIVEEFLQRYGIAVLQSYGATEFAGAIAGWSLKDFQSHYRQKVGSVGRLHAGVEARVVDPTTFEVQAIDQEGLLELKSPQLDGDGWVRTTDMAIVDADGFLWINGRADNAIIRGGFKIHPGDVIAALESHPAVREAIVVGIDDRRLGQVPAAAVISSAGFEADPEELAAYLRGKLLAYQIPAVIRVVEDLPRTTSMKPSLPAVKALFETVADTADALSS